MVLRIVSPVRILVQSTTKNKHLLSLCLNGKIIYSLLNKYAWIDIFIRIGVYVLFYFINIGFWVKTLNSLSMMKQIKVKDHSLKWIQSGY